MLAGGAKKSGTGGFDAAVSDVDAGLFTGGVNKPAVELGVERDGAVAEGVMDWVDFEGSPNRSPVGLPKASFGAAVESDVAGPHRPAGAVILLAIAGAETDVGKANVTFFLDSDADKVAFFCSSSFFRSFAIASASRSCFSHFE